jgi:transcriptional regulator with GAF, ATPase, and Fis domain
MVGEDPAIQRVLRLIEKVAKTDSTVLILGESGTGKEVVARAIHELSPRVKKSMVPVNCGAIPANLLESELFGHVKGAFTGAMHSREGRFELAHNGTIFLDEIGEMSAILQVKLLRVIQERAFEPVGGTRPVEVDVRIVAATNKDLEAEVAAGRFREDLFYRLNVVPVTLPPLRERAGDVPLLLEHFNKKLATTRKRAVKGYSDEALQKLCEYGWPGNVRELENMVERLTVFCMDEIVQIEDLPPKVAEGRAVKAPPKDAFAQDLPEDGLDLREMLTTLEDRLIKQALERTEWNKNRAATLLRMNRTTLVEKLKKRGWMAPDEND